MSTISKPQPRSVEKIPFHKVIEGGTYLYWITENKMFAEGKVKKVTMGPPWQPEYVFTIPGQVIEPIYKVYKPLIIPIPYGPHLGYVKVLDPKEDELYYYIIEKKTNIFGPRIEYIQATLEKKLIKITSNEFKKLK